jgi:hypothetical protein
MIKSARLTKPPSSSGPGRSPFKAKTGVRISVGAQVKPLNIIEWFCLYHASEQKGNKGKYLIWLSIFIIKMARVLLAYKQNREMSSSPILIYLIIFRRIIIAGLQTLKSQLLPRLLKRNKGIFESSLVGISDIGWEGYDFGWDFVLANYIMTEKDK